LFCKTPTILFYLYCQVSVPFFLRLAPLICLQVAPPPIRCCLRSKGFNPSDDSFRPSFPVSINRYLQKSIYYPPLPPRFLAGVTLFSRALSCPILSLSAVFPRDFAPRDPTDLPLSDPFISSPTCCVKSLVPPTLHRAKDFPTFAIAPFFGYFFGEPPLRDCSFPFSFYVIPPCIDLLGFCIF